MPLTSLRRFILCVLFLNIFNPIVSAEQVEIKEKNSSGIGIYLDRDMFVPFSNEDRDYTMGMAVEFFWAKEKGLYPLDGLVKAAGE